MGMMCVVGDWCIMGKRLSLKSSLEGYMVLKEKLPMSATAKIF